MRRGLSFVASAGISVETPRASSWAARAMAWATGRRKANEETGLQRREKNKQEEAVFVGMSGLGVVLLAVSDLVRV